MSILKITSIFLCLGVSVQLAAEERGVDAPVSSITFKENKGQLHDQNGHARADILFYGAVPGFNYYLKRDGISYQLHRQSSEASGMHKLYRLDITWEGADNDAVIERQDEMQGYENYYSSNNAQGVMNVKSFGSVTYREVYKGIDLTYYSKGAALKYDYLVQAGADYKQIRLKVAGVDELIANKDGSLTLKTPIGDIVEGAPVVYQNERKIEANWVVDGARLSFELKNYDPAQSILIDPLVYDWSASMGTASSFYSKQLFIQGTSIDNSGNIYCTGYTNLDDIATTGAYQTIVGSWIDAFLSKRDSTGALLWTTYYGGEEDDEGWDCTVDNAGHIYLAGKTLSTADIATSNGHQTAKDIGSDALLVQFDDNGQRLWATYYGGDGEETAKSCSVDSNGNIIICGFTSSSDNIGTGQSTFAGGQSDGFVARFDATGNRQWGKYFGGSDVDVIQSCAVGTNNNIIICGYTTSTSDVATPNANQATIIGTGCNGFLARLGNTGGVQWGTYLGSDSTVAEDCFVSNGDIYLCGGTNGSSDIATASAYQTSFQGVRDAFVMQFTMAGVKQWGTYFGGSARDDAKACEVNGSGYLYATGQRQMSGYYNAAIMQFNTVGDSLGARYINLAFYPQDLSVAGNTRVVVAGYVGPSLGDYWGYLESLTLCDMPVPIVSQQSPTSCMGDTVILSTVAVPGYTYQWYHNGQYLPGATSVTYNAIVDGGYRVQVHGCDFAMSAPFQVLFYPQPLLLLTGTNTPCYNATNGTLNIGAGSGASPYTFMINNQPTPGGYISNLGVGNYVVTVTDSNGCTAMDSVFIDQDAVSQPSQPLAEICAVTTDSVTGKNMVIWEKNGMVKAEYYNIYRENSIAGQYQLLGTQAMADFSTFTDTASLPAQQSYNYKISEVDSCGNEWPLSDRHKTIHLTANIGVNGEVNLIWNQYLGKTYSTHYIMRSDNGGPFMSLNQVSSTTTSFSDLTPPAGQKEYRIDIDLPTACNPAKTTAYDRIASNIVVLEPTALGSVSANHSIQIVPNPTTNDIRVIGVYPEVIELRDAVGKVVRRVEKQQTLSMKELANGLYFIRLFDRQGMMIYHERVVKQ